MMFRPKEILDKYQDFDANKYIALGYNVLFLDVDNTIIPYYQKVPGKKERAFVDGLKGKGFEVIVFSNNTDKRVRPVAEALGTDYYCWAFKPLPFKMLKVIKERKFDKKKVICMGDQLLTDTLAGNLIGIYTIYVKPICPSDSITTKLNRKIERFIFKYILHEKM